MKFFRVEQFRSFENFERRTFIRIRVNFFVFFSSPKLFPLFSFSDSNDFIGVVSNDVARDEQFGKKSFSSSLFRRISIVFSEFIRRMSHRLFFQLRFRQR